jgi:hypothetical protein
MIWFSLSRYLDFALPVSSGCWLGALAHGNNRIVLINNLKPDLENDKQSIIRANPAL